MTQTYGQHVFRAGSPAEHERRDAIWPTVEAGAPISGLLDRSFRGLADRMTGRSTVDRETVDAAIAYLHAPHTSDTSVAMITTTGRRPA